MAIQPKPKRVLIIDAEKREIREGEVSTLEDMQKLVGGYICRGLTLENGDEIFVNDDGLLLSPEHFFYYEGAHMPFALNGYVTGEATASGRTTHAKMDLEALKAKITFMDRNDVQAAVRSGRFE